ncbi:MAG: nucleoside triphosphate pyrophosphohydrolase [Deltaproteobacteria bacterium]|nr:nucleoside triphosphate pyrophosphohydrolase [Deltaproteobacteria bacterium]
MKKADIEKLRALMERLRGPDGCPWDREQTLGSLAPFIIEEAYEVVSAIDSGAPEAVKEELGDLLFQIIFASRIAEEKGEFGIDTVIDSIVLKMVRRHPHVFGEGKAGSTEEVLKRWAEIKKEEDRAKGKERGGYLGGVPEALPALLRAHKISEKAAKTGFDWKDINHVFEKVTEEMEEFRKAAKSKDRKGMEEEIGDILFTIVNVARFIEVNPEDALRKTVGKFISRFHHIEKTMTRRGKDLSSATLEEMDSIWEEAKKNEKEKTS